MGTSVSDFVFGFSADQGHDLLEIIRKSRVASQARVDAAASGWGHCRPD